MRRQVALRLVFRRLLLRGPIGVKEGGDSLLTGPVRIIIHDANITGTDDVPLDLHQSNLNSFRMRLAIRPAVLDLKSLNTL